MRRSAFAVLVVTSLVTSLVTIATATFANGCSDGTSSSSTPPPLPTGTGNPPPRDGGAESAPAVDASAVDAGPLARRFVGTLAASTASSFGGSPYCNYEITLKQIEFDVTLDGAGVVVNASAKDLAVEETVPPCTLQPMPPTSSEYSLAVATKLANGAHHIELAGFATNRPTTTLVLEGTFDGDHVKGVAEWHRTDQNAPLDWRVKATIPLDLR